MKILIGSIILAAICFGFIGKEVINLWISYSQLS